MDANLYGKVPLESHKQQRLVNLNNELRSSSRFKKRVLWWQELNLDFTYNIDQEISYIKFR